MPNAHSKLLTLAVLTGLSLMAPQAHAWRETGHFAVCEIAQRHLSPRAEAGVKGLLRGADFATTCTWPDQVRKSPQWKHSYDWHFINIDDNSPYLPNLNLKGDVAQALILAEEKLRAPNVSADEKLVYLKFMGHFAGDIHQPLHIGRITDVGGNNHKVEWFGQTIYESVEILDTGPVKTRDQISLHKVWDLHMINKFLELGKITDGSDYNHVAYATAIDRASKSDHYYWSKATYMDWAFESLRDRDAAYAAPAKLGMEYYKKNIGLLNLRVVQAGHRLAASLNRIFGKTELSKRDIEMREMYARARAFKKTPTEATRTALVKSEQAFERSGILSVLCEAVSSEATFGRPSNWASYLERYQKSQDRGFSPNDCKP